LHGFHSQAADHDPKSEANFNGDPHRAISSAFLRITPVDIIPHRQVNSSKSSRERAVVRRNFGNAPAAIGNRIIALPKRSGTPVELADGYRMIPSVNALKSDQRGRMS
jgi:hypothetical protein